MSKSKKFIATAIIATSLIGGVSSASAADTKEAAIARAQAQATFQAEVNNYVNAHRAIMDTLRAANAKALSALANVTTDAELKAAKDARKAAVKAAGESAKAAKAALVKPAKPAKAPKAPKA